MIEQEVEKQANIKYPKFKKAKRAAGRTLAASLAAVMLFGTTVFAGVSVYRMRQEKAGAAGVNVKITKSGGTQEKGGTATAGNAAAAGSKAAAGNAAAEGNAAAAGSAVDIAAAKEPRDIPYVKMEASYLPAGMVQTEQGKYSYQNALYKGGISIVFYYMDTKDSDFQMLHGDVISSEDITVNGHEGVYLEYQNLLPEDEIAFNQRIYVAFTDLHYVMEMYVGSDVTKEEALKTAKGIKLAKAANGKEEGVVQAFNWSEYLAREQEQESQKDQDFVFQDTATKSEMEHTHIIGEQFELEDGLMASVTDVQVSDNFSLLPQSAIDGDFQKELGADGKLRPALIQYIKGGSVDSVSELVKSHEVPQKLIYATVEYTNTGSKEQKDVLFFGSLARIKEEGGQMRIAAEGQYEKPSKTDTWTQASNRSLSHAFEMQYYDVHGGERGNNYIASIKPGETVTVHMGWLATEEELGQLYISLDPAGGASEFTDSSLKMGYVDIRQK